SLLECAFDKGLLSLFTEVQYWEKIPEFAIPYIAHDMCNQREKLRVMREHVMLVVRAYNSIFDDLTHERLFTDHIRKLDKRINQGLGKLTWASKGVVEHFVRDCCAHCNEVHSIVDQFQGGKAVLKRECRNIACLLMFDKATVQDQAPHRCMIKKKLEASHLAITTELDKMYSSFKEGSQEVQREWRELVKEIDEDILCSLRSAIKRSLQELSRAINGDARTEPQTLFQVQIVLEERLDYRPTMINLTHLVNIIAKELISLVTIPRLTKSPTFYSVISNDPGIFSPICLKIWVNTVAL
ncbi:MAG: hypothetical protein AAF152_04615, partial [Cyanobacteria bacterium P01_A01_bin.114]